MKSKIILYVTAGILISASFLHAGNGGNGGQGRHSLGSAGHGGNSQDGSKTR